MSEPVKLPVIPLKDTVVFPNSVVPLIFVRQKDILALEAGLAVDKKIFLATQKSVSTDHPGPDDLWMVGTAADVIQVLRMPDGSAKVLVEGGWTGRIAEWIAGGEHLSARVEKLRHTEPKGQKAEALRRGLLELFEQYATLSNRLPEDLAHSIRTLKEPLNVANAVANYCGFATEDKQRVLEMTNVEEKMRTLSEMLAGDNELLRLENNIMNEVKGRISRTQREYFLNEQLRVIERELGIGSDEDSEIEELQERIKKCRMADDARDKAYRELGRLSRMPALSPEATVSRTYIEWLVDLPWGRSTRDQTDIERARAVLDEDHYGLRKAKDRILEYLAVLRLVDKMKGPILCFVGPPGVGKTSLAKSIARCLKRRFVRISLGGVRDEAEIRGHRRTYIGSLPGRIIQSMKKAGSMNPVFLLDEIDKMSSDFRGDPASALLEVLDPEQNRNFNDHYLEADFDLSRVMFITTANTTGGIPFPLLDRMEIIRVPGYTEEEKHMIAVDHLIPKEVRAHGLKKRQLAFSTEAIDTIIRAYTHEAGVRNLQREIASVCRKAARDVVSDPSLKSVSLTPQKIFDYLGPEKRLDMELHAEEEIGVATGLAWTEAGGEVMPVETVLMPGKGELLLTGKLGDVMKESARAALTWIRAHHAEFGLDPEFHKTIDIHIHVPEGAIPKDGPSAGITMTVSMLSALTKRPVRRDVAMTGEVTLRGRVLRIGGLKEKAVAAHRSRVSNVILPADNEPELIEVDAGIRAAIRFIPARTLADVIEFAFAPPKEKPKTPAREPGKKTARKTPRKKTPGTDKPSARLAPPPATES